MNISNLGRLIGAGLLALGMHAWVPGVDVGDAAPLESKATPSGRSTEASTRKVDVAINGDASMPRPAPQP